MILIVPGPPHPEPGPGRSGQVSADDLDPFPSQASRSPPLELPHCLRAAGTGSRRHGEKDSQGFGRHGRQITRAAAAARNPASSRVIHSRLKWTPSTARSVLTTNPPSSTAQSSRDPPGHPGPRGLAPAPRSLRIRSNSPPGPKGIRPSRSFKTAIPCSGLDDGMALHRAGS